ncbi:MAG: outer membrane protein assembly factor BamD [Gammaproteobacteria bacterium]|nr:outer membrane protein assembly factor BamD [Gammaproteobacteria bacterium]
MRSVLPALFALALGAAILAGCAGGPEEIPPAKVLYERAQTSLIVEDWNRAATQFRDLISTYPFGKYATSARLKLIYAYYRAGNADEAASQADDFLKENPASPYAGYALFLKGISYASSMQPGILDSWFNSSMAERTPINQRKAYTAFQQLIRRYPDTPYAQKAKQWMVFVRNRLASYNLSVARFYADREEWVAAVNRANIVVTQFQHTPSVKPALAIMAQGYRALGEDKLAAAAQAWYDYNYGPKARSGK